MAILLTKRVSFPLAVALLAGCDFNIERTGGPVMNEAQQASDAMTPDAAAPAAAPAGEATPPVAMPANGATAPPVGEQSDTHVGKSTKEVLNAKEMTSDPNWTVVADDPSQVSGFSAAGTAYNRAAALGGTVNLGQWLKQEQALNGSWPTYQQLLDYIEMNPVDMPALREYQHYGYDETTGKVVILENQQEKAKRRNELGLPTQD
ncbi:MAG: hypothetical protein WBC44_07975 [Planctomycetaceae bacterium]